MMGANVNGFQNGSRGNPIHYAEPEFDIYTRKTVQELDSVTLFIVDCFAVIGNLFDCRRALPGACWYYLLVTSLIE